MNILGTAHWLSALLALTVGAVVVLSQKGTRAHRRLGWIYLVAMIWLNATALLIYDLFGGFGPFHWMALASLLTLAGGYVAARRRRRGWIRMHGELMGWSYVGLVAAAVAEGVSRLPGAPFAASVIVSSLAVIGLGGLALRARLPAAIRGMSPDRNGAR